VSISFTCPHCGTQTTVADNFAGQTGPCAQCGRTVTIPPLAGTPGFAPPGKKSSGPAVIVIVLVVLLGLAVICAGVLAALLIPAFSSAQGAARRAQCMNNMKQISLAMMCYQDQHGCYPPAYLADEDGRPMHSWRVLILPYLEEQMLYEQYNFDEPWDSPDNLALAGMMPSIYRCPSDEVNDGTETSYAVIVGPDTAFPGAESVTMAQIRDGMSNTLLAVEATGSGINWLEPRDLDAEEVNLFGINSGNVGGIQSNHANGANAAFCDGSVQSLSEAIDPETLRLLINRSDGMVIDPGSF